MEEKKGRRRGINALLPEPCALRCGTCRAPGYPAPVRRAREESQGLIRACEIFLRDGSPVPDSDPEADRDPRAYGPLTEDCTPFCRKKGVEPQGLKERLNGKEEAGGAALLSAAEYSGKEKACFREKAGLLF